MKSDRVSILLTTSDGNRLTSYVGGLDCLGTAVTALKEQNPGWRNMLVVIERGDA